MSSHPKEQLGKTMFAAPDVWVGPSSNTETYQSHETEVSCLATSLTRVCTAKSVSFSMLGEDGDGGLALVNLHHLCHFLTSQHSFLNDRKGT